MANCQHKCKKCGRRVKNFNAKLCLKCYNQWKKDTRLKKKCPVCHTPFITYKKYYHSFCSLECAYLYRSIPSYLAFKKRLLKLSVAFLSWFTGFWEGEGSISLRPNERTYYFMVSQNDLKVLQLIQKKFRQGKIYRVKLKSGN